MLAHKSTFYFTYFTLHVHYLIFILRQCDGFPDEDIVSRHSDARSNNAVIIQLAVVSVPHSCHHTHHTIDSSGTESVFVTNSLPPPKQGGYQGSHTFNDKKFQDFLGPSKHFSRTLSEPSNV